MGRLWLRITKEYGFLAMEALAMPRRIFRLHLKSITLFPQLWQALVQSTCPQAVDALVPASAHCGGSLWCLAMPQEAFYIHPRESPGMRRHEWCVRYFRFISPYSIHDVVADNLIGCKPRMNHNEDFLEVATYFRGAVKVFELVQSSRDAMRFLICTGCSRLRVVKVYVVVRG